jgi:hypothetical protein
MTDEICEANNENLAVFINAALKILIKMGLGQ